MNTQVLGHPFSRSVLFHLAMLLLAFFVAYYVKPLNLANQSEPTIFEMVEEAPKSADLQKKDRNKSVVKSTMGDEVLKPVKDAFLSDKTRMVKEETSAANPGENSLPAAPQMAVVPKPSQAKPVQAKAKLAKLSDLGLKIAPSKDKANYEKERNWAEARTGEKLKGGEYIQGMKEGEVSALNTKEFVFYSYFERVRRQLDQTWQPLLREEIKRIYKHGRHLASSTDFTTRTLITLNSRGEVSRVQLLEESGTTDLDRTALDALNKAGPYPNPPRGLVDGTGEVQIRWDFILKT